ncbi:uncharacterized protein [Argopecten irradians]|uniref:uncharacterized protein n=1 Tax=Argopecten irradians TaxID=31199 RepID=UPI00371BEF61
MAAISNDNTIPSNKRKDRSPLDDTRFTPRIKLAGSLSELEQYGRRNSLRLHNVPLTTEDLRKTDSIIVKLVNENLHNEDVAITIDEEDINRSHIIGKINKAGKAQLICRFRNWKIKNKMYKAKSLLKNNANKIFVTEDLTKARQELIQHLSQSRMDGFLLHSMFPCYNCIDGYWEEMTSLQNYLPTSDQGITTESNMYSCMLQCLRTQECCFISYIAIASLCYRHLRMSEIQSQNYTAIWYIVRDNGCPCGWYRFHTSCFLFTDVYMTWDDSMAYCKLLDARLAEMDSTEETTFIKSIATSLDGSYWLSGSDSILEGTWLWATSNSTVNMDDWYQDSPDDEGALGSNADCMCIGSWYNFLWDDCNCAQTQAPLCKKNVIN